MQISAHSGETSSTIESRYIVERHGGLCQHHRFRSVSTGIKLDRRTTIFHIHRMTVNNVEYADSRSPAFAEEESASKEKPTYVENIGGDSEVLETRYACKSL